MKRNVIYLIIALLTFVAGVVITAQIDRAAHYIWPDVDPQPKVTTVLYCGH
jgi:hypothetical protein